LFRLFTTFPGGIGRTTGRELLGVGEASITASWSFDDGEEGLVGMVLVNALYGMKNYLTTLTFYEFYGRP
jgi:hypothetical protein